MNTIAVTCWRRPEFLYYYLVKLFKNKEVNNYKLMFFVEVDPDPAIYNVIDIFKNKNTEVIQRSQRISACPASYNILDSYLKASDKTDDFVIIGEEDIIPSEDFLRFCEYSYDNILKKYDKIFCVAHKRRQDPQDGLPNILIGDTQCTSPFIVTKSNIEKYMRPALNRPLFYQDPFRYNSLWHPNSRIKFNEHYDHDGAIERIIEANGLWALKPDQSRTAHVGYYGGAGMEIKGHWKEKIKLLGTLDNEKTLKELRDIYDTRDNKTEVATCELKNYEWDSLELDLNRDKAISSSWWYDPENKFKQYIESN